MPQIKRSSEQFWKHLGSSEHSKYPKNPKSWCWIDQAFPHQKWGFIRSSRHFQTQKSSISPGEVAIFLHFGPEIHTDTTSSGDQRYRRFVSFRQGCWIYLYSICGAVPLPSQPPVSWELVDDPQGTSIYKYRHDQIFETINHQMTSKSVNYNIYIIWYYLWYLYKWYHSRSGGINPVDRTQETSKIFRLIAQRQWPKRQQEAGRGWWICILLEALHAGAPSIPSSE